MRKTSRCAALAASTLALSSSLAAAHGEPGAITHKVAHGYQTGTGSLGIGSLALGALLAGALIVALGYGLGHGLRKIVRWRAASEP